MKNVGIAIVSTLLLMACKDVPYQEKEPVLNLDENKVNNVLSSNYVEKPLPPIEVAEPEISIVDNESSRKKSGRGDKGKPVDVVDEKLPEPEALIDSTAPKIIGANEGVLQSTYLQQKFIEDGKDSRYEIEPSGEPAVLDFANIPTISRWITHIDDEKTAPAYLFEVDEEALVKIP